MLDILSNGRLDFGGGRGSITKHFEGFRVPSAESRDRFEEALTIIRRAWTQDPVEYTGRFWSVPPLSLSPKPVQRPHPPIYRGVVSMIGLEGAGRATTSCWSPGSRHHIRPCGNRSRATVSC